jgi:hypothetical protein
MVYSACDQNKRIGHSVNILGYDPIWLDQAQARMQDKHFQLITHAGYDSVRVNLHLFKHMAGASDYVRHIS